ncbi:putative molybdenum cofactor guanylyltransferase [Deinococcus seoulensis]|uniref:Probable molybdenum cofactor guanylyltransferase n=1 Tax=Deinococcus seoulensis TaxID=1837379 RepID=A0ABQ2RTA3_9DEIO|nr:molybdenum cofactor guanylyltransferase [Deinococcus seoulensis]GGR63252.1 putative molybdenum cofactor guanylyltransferase [Deinococcus seoulensis]
MTRPPPELWLTGAVTAGGRSSRFGSDKALALLDGRTLLERACASLQDCPVRLLIAPPGRYALPAHLGRWNTHPDLRPGEGPLAGLESALTHAPPGWVAFTGVDLPWLTPDYWRALSAAVTSGCLSVQATDGQGRPQPLAALYHTDLLPHVTALLDSGERRLRHAAPPEQTVQVGGFEARTFLNVNTPEELMVDG